jgi:hypothetical protein
MTVVSIARNTLIVSLATSMVALLLGMLIGTSIPLSIFMIGAILVALVGNLVYVFACAIGWIQWFLGKKATPE